MPKVHERSLLIRESHLDTFGHVNNATYLQIFEESRWDWITDGGFGLGEIRERRQGPTIVEIQIRFMRELINREMIIVRTELGEIRGKIFDVRQSILKADGAVACEAVFRCGLFDLAARKLIPPTPQWLAALGGDEG
jgi:YbgC/YbaW family acyl-CoA thioester hydrolase